MPADLIDAQILFPYSRARLVAPASRWPAATAPSTPRSPTRPTRPSRSSTPRSTPRARRRSTVALPADLATRLGDGWKVGLQDTFGEHQLGVWIADATGDRASGAAPTRGRLGRRPGRAPRRARTAQWAVVLEDRVGHRRRRRPSSRPRSRRRSPRRGGPRQGRSRRGRHGPLGRDRLATTQTLATGRERPRPRGLDLRRVRGGRGRPTSTRARRSRAARGRSRASSAPPRPARGAPRDRSGSSGSTTRASR